MERHMNDFKSDSFTKYWERIEANAEAQELRYETDPRYQNMSEFEKLYYPISLLW